MNAARTWVTVAMAMSGWLAAGCTSGGNGDPAPPCEGQAGTFRNQSITVDGEERFFWLHVPATYDCARASAALVDFHGTAGDRPEEAYGLAEVKALADEKGFIVVRPRSRFSEVEGFGEIYRWDQNPGDVRRNEEFTRALVEHIAALYHLDRDRLHAAGFSSGTNMASQFLAGEPLFAGLGLVGGGMWNDPGIETFAVESDAPRIYSVTGYRDYMFGTLRTLLEALEEDEYPEARLWRREADAGHELYGWHYADMWSWLDAGVKPAEGTLATGWTRDAAFAGGESLLELSANAAGDVIAAATDGALWRRDAASGAWSKAADLAAGFAPNFTGVCVAADGRGVAVGETAIAKTADGGVSWALGTPVPEFQGAYFGASHLNSVTCGADGRIVGGGYWTGVQSADGGATWTGNAMPNFGAPAQIAGVEIGPSGTVIAVGYYDYVGRSVGGADFESVLSGSVDWWNDVASGPNGLWIAVGEKGAIWRSTDDGATWQSRSVIGAADLYAVDVLDATTAMAVGAHGAAFVSEDGGVTWQDMGTGLDTYLGDVLLLDPTTALAVGERGTVLRLAL